MDIIILNASTGLGLRTIGAYRTATELRNHGFSVKVIEFSDYIVSENTDYLKKMLSKFMTSSTLWIGISSTWFWKLRDIRAGRIKKIRSDIPNFMTSSLDIDYFEAVDLKKFILSIAPECKIVCGGAGAPNFSFKELYDVYMFGYSEVHAVDYSNWRIGKNHFFNYRIEEDKMILDYNIKADGFDFVNSSTDWSHEYLQPGEALPIEISRGCIFNCKFCSFMMNGKKKLDYIRTPSKIYDEIVKNYELAGVTEYSLSDDTYNDSTEKLEILYNEVWSKLPFKVNFTCYLRLDLLAAHPEQISLLKDSGLIATFFGIESLNNQTNKAIGKGMTEERIIETLHKCKEIWGTDVFTAAGFIIGLPHDTEATCRRWLDKVISPDFPLDTRIIYPLFIGNAKRKAWRSHFEENPEKYGYELEIDHEGVTNWKNPSTWLNTYLAKELAAEYYQKLVNQRPPGFVNTAIRGLGYTRDELSDITDTLMGSHEYAERVKLRRETYWKCLEDE